MPQIEKLAEIMGKIREPGKQGISPAAKGFRTVFTAALKHPENVSPEKLLTFAVVFNLDGQLAEELSLAAENPRVMELYHEAHFTQSPEVAFVKSLNAGEERGASCLKPVSNPGLADIFTKADNLRRSGWKMHRIANPESVAEHSYAVSLLALLFAAPDINLLRAVTLAISHDIQEILTGDYTPHDPILPEEKHKLELQAINEISVSLQEPDLISRFTEYEEKESPEARFVKDLDRADAVLTACYYDRHQRAGHPVLPEFLAYARRQVLGGYQSDIVARIYDALAQK